MLQGEIEREAATAGYRVIHIERDLALLQGRLDRLTDAMIEGLIDKTTYDERRSGLIAQRAALQDRQRFGSDSTFWKTMAERFELGLVALQSYEIGNVNEKREILQTVSSNLVVDGKEPVFPMYQPFEALREWVKLNGCGPRHGEFELIC